MCGENTEYSSNLLPVCVINSILSAVTIFGNSMILLAIFKTPGLRTNSNFFIASLAVADFFVGLVMNPLYAVKAGMAVDVNSHPLTIAAAVITLQTLTATTYNLCCVSIDRYLAIVAVFRYESYVTTERCLRFIGLVWVCSFIVPLPRLFITEFHALPRLWLVSYIVVFIVPLSGISFCYFHIYKTASAQARRIACEHIVDRREAVKIRKNRKATWTAALVIGACFVLWFPSCILSFVQALTSDECLKHRIDSSIWFWVDTLAFASSALNPWIYFLRSREFKQALRRIVVQSGVYCMICKCHGMKVDVVTVTDEEIRTRDKEQKNTMNPQHLSLAASWMHGSVFYDCGGLGLNISCLEQFRAIDFAFLEHCDK